MQNAGGALRSPGVFQMCIRDRYLTDPAALDALKQAAPALSYGKCCARISDRTAFPWEAVRAAIDRCLRS